MSEEIQDIDELNDEIADLFEHFRLVADKGQSLLRIDKFLVNRMEGISRSRIQTAADAGSIRVNNIPVKSNYKIKPLDVVSIVLPHPRRELEIIPQDIPIDIVYEDETIVIVNKAPGMVVHPGHGNYTGTLVNALTYHFKDLPAFISGEIRPGLAHRIDKDTSGLIIIAKTEFALNHLGKQFFDHTTDRTYYALVWGSMKESEGTITGNIGRNPKDRLKMTVFSDSELGKHAVTHYKVIEDFGYVSLVECKLETGRTHQIRVHFESIHQPLFNDSTYGGDKILRGTTFTKYKQFIENCFKIIPRQALHAKSIGFTHPVSGKRMFFDSELPADLAGVVEKWRNYSLTISRDSD